MKQSTQEKFAAILAAAKVKAGGQSTPNFIPVQETRPEVSADLPTQPGKLFKMVSFTIVWQEGSGKYDGKTFTTWATANDAMTRIYKEHEGLGYLKVKISVKWENGAEITDRADCSDSAGDFCPNRGTIGEYLKKQNSVMYASNLNVGDCSKLSFEDEYLNLQQLQAATISEFLASPNFINDAAIDQPELSTLTSADLLGNDTASTETPQNSLEIVDYSDKAFAIIGQTKAIKEELKALGGRFNMFLKCGAGWIFPKTKMDTVRRRLSI